MKKWLEIAVDVWEYNFVVFKKSFHACNEKIYFQSQMSFCEINYGFMRQERKKKGFISR